MLSLLISLVIYVGNDFLTQEKQVKLELDNEYYSNISAMCPADDGGYYLVTDSGGSFSFDNSIFKVSKEGKTIVKFNKKGQGPGEIRNLAGIIQYKGKVFVGERTAPLVHVYDSELNYETDIRTNLGGKLYFVNDNYVGIWNTFFKSENRTFMLALFSRQEVINSKFYVELKTDEVPFLVQAMGGVCSIGDSKYAAITTKRYQVFLFDTGKGGVQNLFKTEPSHILPYTNYEGDPKRLGKKATDWVFSFTKFAAIFHSNGRLYIYYINGKEESYIDVVTLAGKFLHKKIPMPVHQPLFLDNDVFGLVKKTEGEDTNTFHLLRKRISK